MCLEGSASGTRGRLAAADVPRLEALRAFEQVELNYFTFIQRAVTVFLNGRKMNKNVFPSRALDEAVSLCPVKPLYCTLLSHKVLLSPLFIDFLRRPPRGLCLNIPPQKVAAGLIR